MRASPAKSSAVGEDAELADRLRAALKRARRRTTDPDLKAWLTALLADGSDQRDEQKVGDDAR
jgi:hypothetical protein